MRDVTLALITFYKQDTDCEDLRALLGDESNGYRIYGEELPIDAPKDMPKKSLVVRRAPGVPPYRHLQLDRGGIQVGCFAETLFEAARLAREVAEVTKYMSRKVYDGTLLHSLDPIGQSEPLLDPETKWPYVVLSYEFLASETQVA